jgi:hypothetical protein
MFICLPWMDILLVNCVQTVDMYCNWTHVNTGFVIKVGENPMVILCQSYTAI